ncbi:MAG: ATP-binding cassette domain-containing protein [Deltaproteobacteria bacterium]|nr:ATP-binding cassette domain-containing protein [Deltaproteobacteria bacterium]
MIIARNINKSFGKLNVLCGVDLHIKKGSIYGLAGRSGTGKSTFLRCINGLESYDDGNLIVDGVDVRGLPSTSLSAFRKNIGMIFQNFSLLERLTVYDNVALPLKCWKYNAFDIDKKVKNLLALVGISEKIGQKPRALSGGQKQRVAIARALSLEPKILLCDEATSALDPKTAQEIIALLQRINNRMGITIVVVTHQMSVLSSACDEVAILENGRVDSKGPVREIFRQQPMALKNLLGEKHAMEIEKGRIVTISLSADNRLPGQIACDLGIELAITGGKTGLGDTSPDNLRLSFSENDFPDVERYLVARHAIWQIIHEPSSVFKCAV